MRLRFGTRHRGRAALRWHRWLGRHRQIRAQVVAGPRREGGEIYRVTMLYARAGGGKRARSFAITVPVPVPVARKECTKRYRYGISDSRIDLDGLPMLQQQIGRRRRRECISCRRRAGHYNSGEAWRLSSSLSRLEPVATAWEMGCEVTVIYCNVIWTSLRRASAP